MIVAIISIGFGFGQEYETVYFNKSDSTNYYFKVVPEKPAIGLLVLLPGARGNSDWALKASKIPYIAADSGLVTILLQHEIWLGFLRDDIVDYLNRSINETIRKHTIPKNKCVIGGFSSGGTMDLSYTELAFKDTTKTTIIPQGVFGLDAPIDLIELYNINYLEVQGYTCDGDSVTASNESRFMLEKMSRHLGTPIDNYKNYLEHSPFIFSDRYNAGGQAILLKNVPIRIYAGYPLNYLQKKANCGFYFDSAPYLISFLKLKGNQDATFKSIYDEDYKPDGGEQWRGRHEWYGFDSKECVDWIIKTIKTE